MDAQPHRRRLIVPVAPLGGVAMGLMTAALFELVPGDMLDRLILRSGIPAIVAAAEPPLGMTARLVLALIGGGSVALLGWFALFLILGSRRLMLGGDALADADSGSDDMAPVLRRADAHPDAPSRRPVFANRDLGTPFLEVRARQTEADEIDAGQAAAALPMSSVAVDLPFDLDVPMANFDPAAIGQTAACPFPESPLVPAKPADRPTFPEETFAVPSGPLRMRRQIFEPSERFETFELTPMVRADNIPLPEPGNAPREESRHAPRDTQATIAALLERLERGVTHRGERAPSPSVKRDIAAEEGLQETLGALRRMATRR